MSEKYTPGPWVAATKSLSENSLPKCAVLRSFPGSVIPREVDDSTICVAENLTEANAHLISAAPDLLYFMRLVVAELDSCPSSTQYFDKIITNGARAAIAKAQCKS